MSQQIHNPFSPVPSNSNGSPQGGHPPQESQPRVSGNPFQALERAAEANSPFAAADGNFAARPAGGQTGRPAKLPDPRPANMDGSSQESEGSGNPFELVETDRSQFGSYSGGGFQPVQEDQRREHSTPAMMPEPSGQQPQFEAPRAPQIQPDRQSWDQTAHQGHQGYYGSSSNPQPTPQRSSHSTPIRQLELRAIFGVNHELSR